MPKYFYLLLSLASLLLTSCAEQYNIDGKSSVSSLDGRMMYLRLTPDGFATVQTSTVCLDSCRMEHGRFSFDGDVDSVMMALLYSEGDCVMPVVLENGKLSVQVDNVEQRVSGGPLNDKLYKFFREKNRLDNEIWELHRKSMRMMYAGATPDDIDKAVGRHLAKLNRQSEDLDVQFVTENYDNPLGPGVFMLMCSQYPSPVMTTQITRIVQAAPLEFLSNPFVKNYLHQARK